MRGYPTDKDKNFQADKNLFNLKQPFCEHMENIYQIGESEGKKKLSTNTQTNRNEFIIKFMNVKKVCLRTCRSRSSLVAYFFPHNKYAVAENLIYLS